MRRCVRDRVLDVVPRAHHHRVADDHPAGVGLPRGLQDQAARQVTPGGRRRDAVGAQPEVPGAAIQDCPEHAGRIGPWHAQPLHRSTRGDQAGVLAVGKKGVIGDGRKRVPRTARHIWRRGGRIGLHRGAVLIGGRRPLQNHPDIIDRRPTPRLPATRGFDLSRFTRAGFRRSCGQFDFPRLSEPRSLHKVMWCARSG